jgi:hypothetical protein
MRAGLVGYFDIGESYGLGDDVFPESERQREPDIGLVGINFPLGQGLLLDALEDAPAAVARWRAEAVKQVTRPEMETGWSEDLGVSRPEFDRTLETLIASHAIARCRLSIHAVGTVYTELQFAGGIELTYVEGVLSCFEFAAYTPAVADTLLAVARRRVASALGPKLTGLAELSRRDLPEVRTDRKGYAERMLFSSFTNVIACVDDGDDRLLPAVTEAMDLDDGEPIDFEYHGRLHFGWATCVLEPKKLNGWEDEPEASRYTPEQQIERMEADIRVAHVFLGTTEAFTRLFVNEIHEQVGGYVAKKPAGRSPQELNRLRTLALAVVNLTDFDQVVPTSEDQAYFSAFKLHADIEDKHKAIQDATEVLYNVQVAETQGEESKRQRMLNVIVLLLTSLTIISVTADAYDFIRAEDFPIDRRVERMRLLIQFVIGLVVLVALAILATRAPRRRR